MKSPLRLFLSMPLAYLLVACQTPEVAGGTITPGRTEGATLTSTLTPTATPSLPATLTPLPSPAAPTPIPLTPVSVSNADKEAVDLANEEIPIYRQGDLVLRVKDSAGNPLAGYNIEYEQVSHEFQFMTFEDPPSKIRYLRPAGFNSMTLNLWWTLVEPEKSKFNLDFVNYYRNIKELSSGNLSLKAQGVLFLTGSPTDTPSYLYHVSFEELIQLVDRHMNALVKKFGPYIDRWEAINEPDLTFRNPFHLSKDQYLRLIEVSANAIRENDPDALIEINFSEPCQSRPRQMLEDILNAGIDFDVVGLQFYYNAYVDPQHGYQPPRLTLAQVSKCIDDYEALLLPYGKRIAGSEIAAPSEAPDFHPGYWGRTWDEDLQAQYLEAAYTIFFSKPTNMAINYWSGVEPSWFVWRSGLVGAEGQYRKAYWTLQNLLQSWMTRGEGLTDDHGELRVQGFGGTYNAVITDSDTGDSVKVSFDIHEQDTNFLELVFVPNVDLIASKDLLQQLVDYWKAHPDDELVRKGQEYLSLVEHHIDSGERQQAEQALTAGLEQLAITTELKIPGSRLKGYYGFDQEFIIEGEAALLWSAGTAYYLYDFPASIAEIKVTASGRQIDGKWPTMVVGVGDKYSEPILVTRGTQIYSTTIRTTGNERILTIRFLYDSSSDPGEWKLYVDQIDVSMRTDVIPTE